MRLNKNFIGINYYLTPRAQKFVIDSLMDMKVLLPLIEITHWSDSDLAIRKQRLNELHDNKNHKIFYITQKVQDHSELIKFEKINLSWFKSLQPQSSTYIINKNEFFRFTISKEKVIYILHFYKDPSLTDADLKQMRSLNIPMAEFYGFKYDTFIIYTDDEKYPDGYMPENEIWGQNPLNKQKFVKLLLFIELSEPTIEIVKNKQKIKLDSNWEKSLEHRVKNESGVDVIMVNTLWNKIIINDTGFSVSGHIRIQPYGPERKFYKPIWIEEYQKHGFVRGLNKFR